METSFCSEILLHVIPFGLGQIECGFNTKYYHIKDMKQSKSKYCLSHRLCNAIQRNELNYGMEQSL
jgi:hypothetical protein